MKSPIGEEVGEVLGDQFSSRRCYVDTMKSVDRSMKKDQDHEGDPVGKNMKASEIMEEEPELQIRPEEELMPIELIPNKSGFTTKIGTQMSHEVAEMVIRCLRKNVNLFAFHPSYLTGINPDITMHYLNEDPKVKPVKQKLRHFGPEKDKAITEEVRRLLGASEARSWSSLRWVFLQGSRSALPVTEPSVIESIPNIIFRI
ncbi:hypothetical protein ACS0TY_010875 [Phlomoides rotata]